MYDLNLPSWIYSQKSKFHCKYTSSFHIRIGTNHLRVPCMHSPILTWSRGLDCFSANENNHATCFTQKISIFTFFAILCYSFRILFEMPRSQPTHIEHHIDVIIISLINTTTPTSTIAIDNHAGASLEFRDRHLPMFVQLWPIVQHIVLDAAAHASRMQRKERAHLQLL